MGFAWRLPSGESLESFFHLHYRRKELQSSMPMVSEIEAEEHNLLSSHNNQLSSVIELIKLRELEKDFELDDLLLFISEVFGNKKFLEHPSSKYILTGNVTILLNRFFKIREQIIKKLEE